MPEEKNRNALIPRPPSALERGGPRGILTRMVSDALAVARSQEKALTVGRFRIGNDEFCDPDYRQILLWAKALELEPEDVVQRLRSRAWESAEEEEEEYAFEVENGAIISLVWDFDLLPLTVFEWVEALAIRELCFKGTPKVSPQIALRLSFLDRLTCCSINLTELDLSNVPGLTVLWCDDNQITELDIRQLKTKKLKTLDCGTSATIRKRRDQQI